MNYLLHTVPTLATDTIYNLNKVCNNFTVMLIYLQPQLLQNYTAAAATKYGNWYLLKLLKTDVIIMHLCVRTDESDIGMILLSSFEQSTFSEQTRK
jgi:hypothetical protein